MKIYVILLLFLAFFIPMAIKYRIMENRLMTNQTKPCIINLQSDSEPFKSNNLNDGWSENLKIHTPTGAASNFNKDVTEGNLLSPNIERTSRQHPEWAIDNTTNATDTNVKRVGKTCNFGLCLPGN